MNAADIIVILIIVAILALAGIYIYRSKKKGKKCIGCPYSGSCSSGRGGCQGGGDNDDHCSDQKKQ